MKKRAIVSTLASLALAGAMCVGFAACGSESAESIVGDNNVTAEQWAAAFENEDTFKNFKLSGKSDIELVMKMPLDQTDPETLTEVKVSGSQSSDVTFADSNTYGKGTVKITITGLPDSMKDLMGSFLGDGMKEGTTNIEYYVEGTGEAAKFITKVDGKWAYVQKNSMYPTAEDELQSIMYESGLYRYGFEDFEYSEEHKGYITKDADEEDYTIVKFKDGKVKAIIIKSTEGDGDSKQVINSSYVITYEGQKVNLPTVAE